MTDAETINQIIKLKQALARNDDELSSSSSYIGDVHTNRGQKLKRGADHVYHSKLQVTPFDGYETGIGEFQGHQRAIVSKKQKTKHTPEKSGKEDDEDSESEYDDADPYDSINISDLLSPLTNPADLPAHPAMARAFTSRTVRNLARRALDIVNEEHKHTVQFARLMSVFLGDDPVYLKVDKLNLPVYDHLNGVIKKKDGANGYSASASSSTSSHSILKSKSGRSAQSLSSDLEPFFGLPQIHVDRDYGIKPDEAEDARQLTQIAQQRSEEFIRCMVKVRHGLLRAEKYQSKVYRWCREMAGDEDDSDGMESNEPTAKPAGSSGSSNSSTSDKKK